MTKNITNLRAPEQVFEQNQPVEPWMRQKNEPAIWYMRFKRYLDKGSKRSLRAVVASESGTQKATKSTGKTQETKKLSDVSVPGSWKRASKLWRWVERAEAYDLAQMEKQADHIRQVVSTLPFTSRAYRILILNQIASALKEQMLRGMAMDDLLKLSARLQSLMRDIATEMESLEGLENIATTTDACAHKYLVDNVKQMEEQEDRIKKLEVQHLAHQRAKRPGITEYQL